MPVFVLCRDQDPETGASVGADCPGCDSTDPQIARRSMRGAINLIWRDAPVFEKDSENKFVKDSRNRWVVASREDQIAVWSMGPTVLDEIITEGFETPGDLTGRDFKITRRGTGKETTYDIRPAERDGGQKPLSKSDQTLADQKYDLTKYEAPPSLENWWDDVPGVNQARERARPSFATQHVPADVSPFTNDE
jgi:molybdopterin-guanine dinucleotide biosynthesis protein